MADTLVPSARQTLIAEVLHIIEDFPSPGCIVEDVVRKTEKSETTIRKVFKNLEDGGFIRKNGANGRKWLYVAVRKSDTDTAKGGDNMADTKTKTKAKAAAPAEKTGRGGRPKDPEVQARDQKVLGVITDGGGATVGQISDKLGIEKNLVYISIWRLRTAGMIKKQSSGNRAPLWTKAS